MSDMTQKEGRVTTAQLFEAIEKLTERVQSLEGRFDMRDKTELENIRRIAHDEAVAVNQINVDRFESLVQRVEASANGMQRVFSELVSEQSTVQRRMQRVEVEQEDVRRLIRDTQSMSASVQNSLTLISDLIKSRDAQVQEHAHDIDELQKAKDRAAKEIEAARESERDLRFRMGAAVSDIVGFNPALPEGATRRFPNFSTRLESVEKTTQSLQADVEAVRVAVAGIDTRFDAIGQTINRVLPPKVRRVAGNVWVLRAVAILGGLLLSALGVGSASDVLNSLLTP